MRRRVWIRAAPRHVLGADSLTCARRRAHANFHLESCFGFVGDKRDGRAPEPTIFIAHDDRRSWTFECAAWSFVCRNIPPCRRMISFVRPVRWNSARVRFRREARRNRCRRASCPSTKGRIAGTNGSGWARDLHQLSTVATQVQAVVFAVRIVRSPRCTRPKPPSRHAGVRTGVRKDRS